MLRVRRGVTYTFIVEAGDDVNDGPNYHPFYITNSIDGGILLDTPEQRAVSVNMIAYNYHRKHTLWYTWLTAHYVYLETKILEY